MNINNAVDKAYEKMSLKEILKQPLNVLQGLSERQANLVKEAFKISTIEQFCNLRFAKWAWSIKALEKYENKKNDKAGSLNIDKAVDKAWQGKSLSEILNAPLSALQGLSERQAELLNKAFRIKTIKQLANQRFILIARAIYFLALCED